MPKETEHWNNVYRDIAVVIGEESTHKLHHLLRGETVTYPTHLYQRNYVIQLVKEAYASGQSVHVLAHKWGYSVRTIRTFIVS